MTGGGEKKLTRSNRECVYHSGHIYFACCPVFARYSAPLYTVLTYNYMWGTTACEKVRVWASSGESEEVPRRELDLRP
jgi:hypothetical protein